MAEEIHRIPKDALILVCNASKAPDLRWVIKCGEGPRPGTLNWEEVVSRGAGHDVAVESALRLDDSIKIQFTSDTTGQPKAATLAHHTT